MGLKLNIGAFPKCFKWKGRTDHLLLWHKQDILKRDPSKYDMKYLKDNYQLHCDIFFKQHAALNRHQPWQYRLNCYLITLRTYCLCNSALVLKSVVHSTEACPSAPNFLIVVISLSNRWCQLPLPFTTLFSPPTERFPFCCRFMDESNMPSIGKALNMSSLNAVSSRHR